MLARTALLVSICCLLFACAGDDSAGSPGAGQPLSLTDSDIAENNRGVALMGYFDYAGARDQFQAVVDRQPKWLDARVNLAIATLNRQQEGDEVRALEELTTVLSQDPGNLRAHYVSGLLLQNAGDIESAEKHFLFVVEADPGDAYAHYHLGQVKKQLGRTDEAIALYERAIELDPYLRSAYYGALLALRQSGRNEEAKAMLDDYQRFEHNPRARLAELKYTRMGPKANALAVDAEPESMVASPTGAVFGDAVPVGQLPQLDARSTMTTVDIDADGVQELFITRAGSNGGNVLVDRDGEFLSIDHPLTQVTDVNAVAWGDYDNDGLVDVYLCRNGSNQLWQQGPAGWKNDWTDVTAQTATANGQRDCADVLMIDADHDGDLDLFVVNRDGPNELLSNNLDGTFRPLAADQGIAGRGGSLGAIAGDLDNDRDLDLIVIKGQPPHEVFLNDRLWQYRVMDESSAYASLMAASIRAATLADTDTDGRVDLLAVHDDGAAYRWDGATGLQQPRVLIEDEAQVSTTIGVSDFDGDGHVDVLRTGTGHWDVYSPATSRSLGSDAGEIAAVLPVFDAETNGPALFVAAPDGTVRQYPAGPGRHAFAAFSFSGKEEQADSMRSNRDGTGTRVELRVGSNWTVVDKLDRHSAPGQSLQPLMLGLGGAAEADFIALTWSDGVFQTELGLAAGKLHRVEETQRQLSSCPVLFAWDGEKYRFVTDLLGVGGLGFFVEPGVAATPRPWEYLLLPPGSAVAKDGLLSFKLTEPMEELAYLDSVRLHIYDVPAGVSMVMDDRMVIEGPPATGQAYYYEESMTPVQAINGDGLDVTRSVLQADLEAAPVGAVDKRFIGRLADTHVLTVDFSSALDAKAGTPLLIIDGWLEYPYSQTVFAAWQAGAAFEAPTLEAYGRDGYWHTVYTRFGYPAGMPRQMMLPLNDLPAGTMRLRLSTNQEIYWDRIAVAHSVSAPVSHRSIAPVSATQRLTGFPRRTTNPQRVPEYDYSQRDIFWDTRYPTGSYSAFGSVIDLVQRTDDAVAIIGPGEEIEFAFAVGDESGPVHPVPAGFDRHFVIEVRGWAKDMDLYTRDGETVGPLPMRNNNEPPDSLRDALHRRYHTRYQSGR